MLKTHAEVKEAISSGKTVLSILEGYLKTIESNKELNIFLEVFDESAKRQAETVDQKLKAGTAGKLAGMVVGIKDNLAYKNHKVSASSRIL